MAARTDLIELRKRGWPLLAAALLAACGPTKPWDTSTDPDGSAGSASVPSASDCATFAPCGGKLTGRWRVRAPCVGTAVNDPACENYASNQSVSGVAIYDFGSDGVLRYEGAVSFSFDISVNEACAQAIAHKDAQGYCKLLEDSADDNPNIPASISCEVSAGPCECHIVQGPISSGTASGYVTSGTSLTIDQSGNLDTLSYCVKGDTLTFGSVDGLPSVVFSRE
jgi:hypothetical protein